MITKENYSEEHIRQIQNGIVSREPIAEPAGNNVDVKA